MRKDLPKITICPKCRKVIKILCDIEESANNVPTLRTYNEDVYVEFTDEEQLFVRCTCGAEYIIPGWD